MSAQAAPSRVTEQGAQRGVLVKLVIFSISLGAVPLASYFGSEKYLWNGNSTYAAITAIVAANVVLVAYIVVSLIEDSQAKGGLASGPAKPGESRKER
ncbi:hypothetical protein OF83DRAFT_1168103 [Amylostereum chailletii]|nr:hypothetical protein OF83DRAFT_1168103 [Amylostereum chailletii]